MCPVLHTAPTGVGPLQSSHEAVVRDPAYSPGAGHDSLAGLQAVLFSGRPDRAGSLMDDCKGERGAAGGRESRHQHPRVKACRFLQPYPRRRRRQALAVPAGAAPATLSFRNLSEECWRHRGEALMRQQELTREPLILRCCARPSLCAGDRRRAGASIEYGVADSHRNGGGRRVGGKRRHWLAPRRRRAGRGVDGERRRLRA